METIEGVFACHDDGRESTGRKQESQIPCNRKTDLAQELPYMTFQSLATQLCGWEISF